MAAKATAAGLAVGIYAARLLDTPLLWTRLRTVYRLLGLVPIYGFAPVDQACPLALELDVVYVTKIARMLEQASERGQSPPIAARQVRDRMGHGPLQAKSDKASGIGNA